MARSSAKIIIKVWTDRDQEALTCDEQELAETLAPHVERIAGLCAQNFTSGDVYEEGKFRGWWEVKR